ncbi:hypothetical protein [Mesobacterium pallidum]|uniref:hypothetical protein n=1 Tax=Mesobacterium pallidum TaxID=2872037 RepID=UPI001EE1B2D9|nr:hypothetical protein [Mesobacterium pallidum]
MVGARDDPVFPEPLGGGYVETFCYELRDLHGFDIGPIEVEQVLRVLAALELSGQRIRTAAEAWQYLSPVLARAPEEQRLLRDIISSAFVDAGGAPVAVDEPGRSKGPVAVPTEITMPDRVPRGPLFYLGAIGLPLAGLGLLVALFVWLWRDGEPVPAKPCDPTLQICGGEPPSTSPFDLLLSLLRPFFASATTILAVLVGALVLGLLIHVLRRVRRLAAERDGIPDTLERLRPTLKGAGPIFFAPGDQTEARIAQLTRHEQVETRKLDAPATALRTVLNGGYLTLVHQSRKVQPEFTILFQRASHRDQFQILVEDLRAAIAREHIHVDRFDYISLPERPVEIGQDGKALRTVSFESLVAKAEQTHILLVAHPDDLVRSARQVVPWLARLARHGRVTVLSTVPLAQLRRPMGAMRKAGIDLYPAWTLVAAEDGDDRLGRASRRLPSDTAQVSDFEPSEGEQVAMGRWLTRTLSPQAREVLAGLSIYPEISVAMTRALIARLKAADRRALLDGGTIGQLIGLRWMRVARLPDWAMQLVRRDIPDARLFELRDAVQDCLVPDSTGRDAISLAIDDRVFGLPRLRGAGAAALVEAVVGRQAWRHGELAVFFSNAFRGQQTSPATARRMFGLFAVMVTALGLTYAAELRGSAQLAEALAYPVLAVAVALHMVGQSTAPRATVQLLNWVAWAGLLVVVAQSLGSKAPAPLLAPAGVLYAVFLGRGPPGTARSFEEVLAGMSWVTAGLIFMTVMFAATSLPDSLTGLAGLPLLSTAILVSTAASSLAWPLRAPLRDAFLVSALGFALAGRGIWDLFALDGLGFALNVPGGAQGAIDTALSVFASTLLLAAAVFAHLEWRGATPHRTGWIVPIRSAGLFALLATVTHVGQGFGVVIAFAPFATFLFIAAVADIFRLHQPGRELRWIWMILLSFVLSLGLFGFVSVQFGTQGSDAVLLTQSLAIIVTPALVRLAFPWMFKPFQWTVFTQAWPKSTARAWVLALPAGAAFMVFGTFSYAIGPLTIDFTAFAIPMAAMIAYGLGRAGFWAVAIGGLLFWVQYDLSGLSMRQTPAEYFACLLVARVIGSAELRHEIITTAALTTWQLLFLSLGFALTASYYFGAIGLVHAPQVYLEVVLLLIGLSRVRLAQIAPLLTWCWVASVVIGTMRLDWGGGFSISPTLRGTSDIVALFVCFLAGRALRDLLVNPRAYDHLRPQVMQGLLGLIALDLLRLSYQAEFDAFTFFLALDPVPYVAKVLGFVALGLIGGWHGVTRAFIVSFLAYFILPVILASLPDVNVEFGGLQVGYYTPGSGLGVQYDIGRGVSIGLGYPLLSLFGLWARRALFRRAGLPELDRASYPDLLGGIRAEREAGRRVAFFASLPGHVRDLLDLPRIEHSARRPALPFAETRHVTPYLDADSAAALLADHRALTARGRISAGGHPVLRALWLDRVAVLSGIVVLFYVPVFLVLLLFQADPVPIEPIGIPFEDSGLVPVPDTAGPDAANGALIGAPTSPDGPVIEQPIIEQPVIEDPIVLEPIVVEPAPDPVCTFLPWLCR